MNVRFLAILTLAFAAMSANAEEPYTHQDGYFESREELFESEFSEWHLVSDMQRIFDEVPKEFYWAYQEGRNYKGVAQIRWIQRERPESNFKGYHISGMMTHDEFYSYDMRMHESGYERVSMQVFVDASGVARHQAVWVNDGSKVEDTPSLSNQESSN